MTSDSNLLQATRILVFVNSALQIRNRNFIEDSVDNHFFLITNIVVISNIV